MEKVLTNRGLRRSSTASIFSIVDNHQVQGASLEGQEPRAALKIKSSSTSHFMLLQQSRDSSRKRMKLLIKQL
ncbi:hypothetical protein SLEP1_g51788 [Rubroshorea leprosula]|uniref:Uncharacterized protein n=1 Tax=Rubroshorea leprosula TaxID=152421 RepID=A0AAV5M4G2_9ROSI|nr:hypothetical protein SLEP1_g51788 [Rubroshorea leprosula]